MNSQSAPDWKARLRLPLRRPATPAAPAALDARQGDPMPPLDLLRERRRQLGVVPLSGLLTQRPVLVRRGLTIGGLALGVSVGVCGLLLVWNQVLRARVGQLERYEVEAKELGAALAVQGAALKQLRGGNDQLVKRLSDVRSSSALLADLQLRVPAGVQLTKVQMLSPTEMRLEGLARDPVPFGRVNAMELVLRRSPLFLATGVTIEKVERQPLRQIEVAPEAGGRDVAPGRFQLSGNVRFQMKATLSELAANRLVGVMESLGAEGMARRLDLLQREGLLK